MSNRFPLGNPRWAVWFSTSGFLALLDAAKRHAATAELLLTSAGVLAFIAAFHLILEAWKRGRSGLWQGTVIVAIGTLFAPFNAFAWLFFTVACALAAVVGDGHTRAVSGMVAAILATAVVEKLCFQLPWSFVGIIAGAGVPIAVMCTLTMRRSAAVRELARQGERERIARDMHDVLGQTLSVIILKIDLAARLARSDPERLIRELMDADRIARETLDEVRATLRGYRARSLEDELERAKHTLTAAGITVSTHFTAMDLDPSRESALCLALREGVTNVVRHSHATTAQFRRTPSRDNALSRWRMTDAVPSPWAETHAMGQVSDSRACVNGYLHLGEL